ncbi:hypothetical protein ZWY2020_047960 [Hordeum vulgare]|nr:hypothetical protein ZWY2020_047960 [Hordeum vulgare]
MPIDGAASTTKDPKAGAVALVTMQRVFGAGVGPEPSAPEAEAIKVDLAAITGNIVATVTLESPTPLGPDGMLRRGSLAPSLRWIFGTSRHVSPRSVLGWPRGGANFWSMFEYSVIPHHAGCAEFSSEVVKELVGAINMVNNTVEEECHDLLSLAASHVFQHVLLRDPRFEFAGVKGPMPEESCGNLANAIGGHVRTLLEKFSCDDDGESDKEPLSMP